MYLHLVVITSVSDRRVVDGRAILAHRMGRMRMHVCEIYNTVHLKWCFARRFGMGLVEMQTNGRF